MLDVDDLCIKNVWSLMYRELFLIYLLFKCPLFLAFLSRATISKVVKFNKESDIGVCGSALEHCYYNLAIVCICNSKCKENLVFGPINWGSSLL